MSKFKVLEDLMEDRLLSLHTAYIGKVISFDGSRATIQPLGMSKQYGKPAKRQSIVCNAPVVQSARNKLQTVSRTCKVGADGIEQREHLTLVPLAAGDLVFCVCAERDITQAKEGRIAQPQIGHHSLSDSVVVGIL